MEFTVVLFSSLLSSLTSSRGFRNKTLSALRKQRKLAVFLFDSTVETLLIGNAFQGMEWRCATQDFSALQGEPGSSSRLTFLTLLCLVSQMVTSEQSPLSFLPTDAQAQVSPPPPYPTPQELPQPLLQQPHGQEPPAQQPQAAPSLPQSDFQLLTAQVSLCETWAVELIPV